MSEHADGSESAAKRLPPVRRLRVSILEMMLLVAALAVSFRWPGLTVPVGLLFLYTLARRRDILRRQTRVALGQIAVALYLPPVLAFLALHFWGSFGSPDWRQYWAFVGRDYFLGFFIGRLSLMPAVLPGFLIMVTFRWAGTAVWSLGADKAELFVLSMITLAMIGGLGVLAKRGIAWRIPCLIVALGLSTLSTYFAFVLSTAGA
jgi:hypothetical protein